MPNEGSEKALLKAYLLALLHDPPWKSYTIAGKFARIRCNPFKIPGQDNVSVHETQGLSLINDVIELVESTLGINNIFDNDDDIKEVWKRVKSADKIASAIERKFVHKTQELFTSSYNVLMNPFNPSRMAYGPRWLSTSKSYKAYSTVREAAMIALRDASRFSENNENNENENRINRIRAFVHSFTSLLEPLYMEAIGTPSPAETRQPDHTVFDHALATASIAYARERGNSLTVVSVKLGGFKEFVASSRKLSDAWFGSWLASALIWSSVKELVWEHGPGSLLVPSIRWNQFYLSLLKAKGLEETVEILGKFYLWEGFPYYPTMPAFAVLILPSNNNNTGDIVRRLQNSWESAVLSVIDYLESGESSFSPCFVRSVVPLLIRIVDKPPFSIKVYFETVNGIDVDPDDDVRINEVAKNIANAIAKVLMGKTNKENRETDQNEPSTESRENDNGNRMPGWIDVDWSELTVTSKQVRKRIEEGEGCLFKGSDNQDEPWRVCSVCAKLPGSFIALGRETQEGVSEEYRKFSELMGVEEPEVLMPIFKPGERLCPYCLFKRLASLPSVFDRVAKELIELEPSRRISFPSVDDIAALSSKLALLELIKRMFENDNFNINEVKKYYEEIFEKVKPFARTSEIRESIFNNCPRLEECRNEELTQALTDMIEKRWWNPRLLFLKIKEVEESCENSVECKKLLLTTLLALDIPFFNVYPLISEELNEIAKVVEENIDNKEVREILKLIRNPKRYFALIRFDADNGTFTKIGVISRGGKRIKSLNDVFTKYEYVSVLFDSLYKLADDVDEKQTMGELKSKVMERTENRNDDELPTRWPTPGYLSLLSAAMSYTIMRTVRLINELGGVVIFAAGDEGLAALPTYLPPSLFRELGGKMLEAMESSDLKLSSNQALNFVALLRRLWWASSSAFPGFHPVRKEPGRTLAYLPAMLSGGMSVGVRFAHHKDHLHSEIEIAEELLEIAKESYNGNGDSVAFGYGRGLHAKPRRNAEENYATLKLSEGNWSPWDIMSVSERVFRASRLLALIEEGKVSVSLTKALYNFFGNYWEFIKSKNDPALLEGTIAKISDTYASKPFKGKVKELLKVRSLEELEQLLRVVSMGYLSER